MWINVKFSINIFANQYKLPHEDNPMPLPEFFYRTEARLNSFQIDEISVKKSFSIIKD